MFFFLLKYLKFDLRQKFYYSSLNWGNENTHEFSSVCCRQKFASLQENGLKIEAEMKCLNFLCEPVTNIFSLSADTKVCTTLHYFSIKMTFLSKMSQNCLDFPENIHKFLVPLILSYAIFSPFIRYFHT